MTKQINNNASFSFIHAIHTPPSIFTIFDYTQLVYPLENSYLFFQNLENSSMGFACQKQVTKNGFSQLNTDWQHQPQKKNSFLKIQHKVDCFHFLGSTKDYVVSLESFVVEKNSFAKKQANLLSGIMSMMKISASPKNRIAENDSSNSKIKNQAQQQLFMAIYHIQSGNEFIVKISSSLLNQQNKAKYRCVIEAQQKVAVVIITVEQASGIVNQFVYIDLQNKVVRTNGFAAGEIRSICMGDLNSFSVLTVNQSNIQKICEYCIESCQDRKQYKIIELKAINLFEGNKKQSKKFQRHCFINGQYVLFAEQGKLIATYLNNKLQYLQNEFNPKEQTTGFAVHHFQKGFLLLKYPYLLVWQKGTINFALKKVIMIAQAKDQQKGRALLKQKMISNLVLSQQQSLIAFHIITQDYSKIIFNNRFSQFLQSPDEGNKNEIMGDINKSGILIQIEERENFYTVEQVFFGQLSGIRHGNTDFYGGNEQFFIQRSGNLMKVMSTSTFSAFLSVSLQKITSTNIRQPIMDTNLATQSQISTIAIHPTEPLVAVAFANSIRIYKILMEQLLLVRDIPLSRCKLLLYSNSGSILSAIVTGKQGTKVYLYNTVKYEYKFIENISIGKKILALLWGHLDSRVYMVYQSGYFYWDIGDTFKIRKQSSIQFSNIQSQKTIHKEQLVQKAQQPNNRAGSNSKNFKINAPNRRADLDKKSKKKNDCINQEIKGATIGENSDLILWSQRTVYRITNHEQVDQQSRSESSSIKQILYKNGIYIFHMQDGLVISAKSIDLNDSLGKPLQIIPRTALKNNSSKTKLSYNISHLFANKFICKEKNGNSLIASTAATFKKESSPLRQDVKRVVTIGKNRSQVVMVSKKNVQQVLMKHRLYQAQIVQLHRKTQIQIDELKIWFRHQIQNQQQMYLKQIQNRDERIRAMKDENAKMSQNMEQKEILQQKKSFSQVKDLEKLYQRKLALITNKYLTSQEINFRHKKIASNQMKELDQRHHQEIEKVRQVYQGEITDKYSTSEQMQRQILSLKKEYETKILAIQQENQLVLAAYQERMEEKIQILKKNAMSWQVKFGQCLSKKDNIQRQFQQQILSKEKLSQNLYYVQNKKEQAVRRSQNLVKEFQRMELILDEKNQAIKYLEKRIQDLQKSNQILKFRVLELKESNDPKQQEIEKIKQNLQDLESQYEKIMKSAHDSQLKVSNLKRQNNNLRQTVSAFQKKAQRMNKRFEDLINRVRESTKLPYQQIRKQLISILNSFSICTKENQANQISDNRLGQLNRIREHLESTLGEVVQSNKKSEQHRKVEMMRRNHENSQLLQQINDLRRKVKTQEEVIKQKSRLISEYRIQSNTKDLRDVKDVRDAKSRDARGSENFSATIKQKQRSVERQQRSLSKDFTRNKTRETFYEKSLFKTYWKENTKRIKNQHGSTSKKSSHSIVRDTSYAPMIIEPSFEQIQHLKRVIDQKETIIKQLINKIQNR